jgi:hypothetical protein
MLHHRRDGGIPSKGHFAGQQFVDNDAERIDVAARIYLFGPCLFRAHVLGRSHNQAGAGCRSRGLAFELLRDTEVHEANETFGVTHDIGRLEISMNYPSLMYRTQTIGDLLRYAARLGQRHPPALPQELLKVDSSDILHYDVSEMAVLAVFVDRADVSVADSSRQPDFIPESPTHVRRPRNVEAEKL